MDKKETISIKIINFVFKRFNFKTKKRFVFFVLILIIAGLTIVGSVIASSIFSTDSLNKGLVGHWPLDGAHLNSTTNRVDDISGYENHGTNSGASLTTDRYGQANGAMSFSGNYIEVVGSRIPDQSQFEQEWSVTAWVNINDTASSQFLTDMAAGVKLVHSTTDKLLLYLNSGDNDYYIYSSQTALLTGQGWKFVTFLFRNSDGYRRIYIDGVNRSGSGPNKTYTPLSLSSTLRIGSGVSGSMSDVRIYNRVLSTDEITRLYESYKPKISVGSLNQKLVGHWPLRPEGGKTARSCKAILDNGHSTGDGTYVIDPDGPGGTDSFQVYCDMTTDGGGWTLAFDETAVTCITQNIDSRIKNMPITEMLVYKNTSGESSTHLLFSGLSSLQDAFDQSWTASGFETDNYKPLGVSSGDYSTTVYFLDDNDIGAGACGGCSGRQINYSGTPNGLISFGFNNLTNWPDAGTCAYDLYGSVIDKLLVRESAPLRDTSDTTSNSNHGTVYGADIRNHGASFNGSSNYVSVGTGPKPTSAITMAAWVKPASVGDAIHNVIDHHYGYEFQERADSYWRTYIYLSTTGWASAICTSLTVQANKWYFVSGTYDSTTGMIKTYVNGALCATSSGYTGQTISYGSTDKTYIGSLNNGLDRFFNGQISDVLIYDRALSAPEILDLYQNKDVAGTVLDMPLSDKTGFKDVSGNANHGTNSGADIIGEAADFDGSDDYVDCSNSTDFDFGTDSFSITGWINANVFNNRRGIISKRSGGASSYWQLTVIDGKVEFYVDDGPNIDYVLSPVLNIEQWYFIVGVVDRENGLLKISVDGAAFSNTSNISGSSDFDNTASLQIGYETANNDYFDGSIADVKIYNRDLSEPEVKSLYAKGRSGSSVGMTTGSLNKGFILDMPLKSKNEKVGSELLSYNSEFDNGYWGKGAELSVSANTAETTDPIGGNAADKITASATSGYKYFRKYLSTISGKTYQLGVYVKAGTFDRIGFRLGSTSSVHTTFTISTKTWSNIHSEVTNYGYRSMDNGWYYAWIHASLEDNTIHGFALPSSGGAEFHGNSGYLYVYGATSKELHTADTTPNANHGTIYGADVGTNYTTFDGSKDYIKMDVGDQGLSGDQTLVAWIKHPATNPNPHQTIICTDTRYQYGIKFMNYYHANVLGFWMGNGSSNTFATVSTNVNDDQWHFVVASYNYNSGEVIVYKDGQAYTPISVGQWNVSPGSSQGVIGAEYHGIDNDYGFNGSIANTKIYNRVLSEGEINSLFDKERGQFGI